MAMDHGEAGGIACSFHRCWTVATVRDKLHSMGSGDKHVVVVGAGFGGLRVASSLMNRPGLRVTMVDRKNHHLFQPLLYQVATAGLNPADIASPVRAVIGRARNVAVQMAEVEEIKLADRVVVTDRGDLDYDYLVLACGATHSYFGNGAWEKHAPGLKSLEQATEIRRRILTAFERAEVEMDVQRRRQWLTFVVVGAGPTGVEIAGALGELSRFTLDRDFRNIDPRTTRVVLIEGGKRILGGFDANLAARAARDLEKLGVSLWTERRVTGIDADGVWIGDERLEAKTVVWAAGVKASPLNQQLGAELDRAGRVKVEPDLSLSAHAEVFVIGDQAHVLGEDGRPLPGVAQPAIQGGRCVADNILRDFKKRSRKPFRYRDKGSLATIGRASAIADLGFIKVSGLFAWMIWCFVHVAFLIGFRNRLLVLTQWAWSYFRYKRGARLITRPTWQQELKQDKTAKG